MASDAERVLLVFKTFDVDGDGAIERSELARLLRALNERWDDDFVDEFIRMADMNDDGLIQYSEFVGWIFGGQDSSELLDAGDSLASTCPPGMTACRFGAGCYNRKPGHRLRYWHPADLRGKDFRREVCRFGSGCYRKSTAHLERFAHPGDRNYRKGLVKFGDADSKPSFETLLQLFDYHDPNESGHLTMEEFRQALEFIGLSNESTEGAEEAWAAAGGASSGYVNFSRFAAWASEHSDLPLGVSEAGGPRPCHFRVQEEGGWSCGCADFEAVDGGRFCQCGHKESAHRSRTESLSDVQEPPEHWARDEDGRAVEGLVEVTDDALLEQMQGFFDAAHKGEDNWTRDRGCSIHGRSHPDCDWGCMKSNGNKVPTGFRVRKVFRNQNAELWRHYALSRNAIFSECEGEAEFVAVEVPGQAELEAGVVEGCNEWRLFHSTNIQAARGICASNFRLSLSGTGATWKAPGKDKGSPLYGFGIYLAEMVTKSDEYAEALPEEEEDAGLYPMLVVRCIGGRSNIVETNEIDKDKLKNDVFDGPYHSVFGDRVKTLGKPYREVVVYDKDQIFPEYLVLYERLDDS